MLIRVKNWLKNKHALSVLRQRQGIIFA